MKLTELQAAFLKCCGDKQFTYDGFTQEVPFSEADGVWFLCPKCFLANNGPVGTHWIICWRPRVSQAWSPMPGRWEFEGTGLDNLTLVAGSSSVLLTSGCQAHFFVRNGEIVNI